MNVRVKEVPSSLSKEFLQDVDKDPKFLRFHDRMAAASTLSDLRNERHATRQPLQRKLLLALWLCLAVAALGAALPWFAARLALVVAFGIAIVVESFVAGKREFNRQRRLAELDEQIEQCEQFIAEVDKRSGESIKIIDPDTFGVPPKQREASQAS